MSFVEAQNVLEARDDSFLAAGVTAGLRVIESYPKFIEQFIFREALYLLHASVLCAATFAFARYWA